MGNDGIGKKRHYTHYCCTHKPLADFLSSPIDMLQQCSHMLHTFADLDVRTSDKVQRLLQQDNFLQVRVYTKKVGAKPDFGDPVILSSDRGGTLLEHLCRQIHNSMVSQLNYALVWGTSSKHYPQRYSPGMPCKPCRSDRSISRSDRCMSRSDRCLKLTHAIAWHVCLPWQQRSLLQSLCACAFYQSCVTLWHVTMSHYHSSTQWGKVIVFVKQDPLHVAAL